MILDSEFLIAIREGEPAAEEKATELEVAGPPLRVPTVVVMELFISVGLGETPVENQRAYEQLIENKPIVELDETIARRAGVLEGEHRRSDSKPQLGIGDAIVAATGLTFNEAVVTKDRDFRSVGDLDVELV